MGVSSQKSSIAGKTRCCGSWHEKPAAAGAGRVKLMTDSCATGSGPSLSRLWHSTRSSRFNLPRSRPPYSWGGGWVNGRRSLPSPVPGPPSARLDPERLGRLLRDHRLLWVRLAICPSPVCRGQPATFFRSRPLRCSRCGLSQMNRGWCCGFRSGRDSTVIVNPRQASYWPTQKTRYRLLRAGLGVRPND